MSRSPRLCATAVVALILAMSLMLVRPAPAATLVFGSGVGFPGDVVTVTATLDSLGAGISVASRVMWEIQGRSFRYSAIHSEAVPPDQSLPWMKGCPPHSTFSIGALR